MEFRVAEDMQVGGTFDASGAFRDERWSDEEDADVKKKANGKKSVDDGELQEEMGAEEAADAIVVNKSPELKESSAERQQQPSVENSSLTDAHCSGSPHLNVEDRIPEQHPEASSVGSVDP